MFKVVWDRNNTVRLTMASMGEALNVSPRPVFFEELNLLEMDKKGWRYPESKEPLMWACDRRYFYEGELVMEVKGGNIFDAPTVQVVPGKENLLISPVDMDYPQDSDTRHLKAVKKVSTAYLKLLFPHITSPDELDREEFEMYCLAPAIHRRDIIRQQCNNIDYEPTYAKPVPDIRVKAKNMGSTLDELMDI